MANVKKPALKQLRVSPKASPLAQRVAKLCRAYRKHRGWSQGRAAELLGIRGIHYRALEKGNFIPGPRLCSRIRGWIVEKLSYEGAEPLTEMAYLPRESSEWRLVKVPLETSEAKRLRTQALALGMSSGALGSLYIKQGLRSRQAYATLAQAIDEVQLAFSKDALTQVPDLADLLRTDSSVLESKVELTPWHQVQLKAPIMQVVEIPLDFSREEQEVVEDD